MTSNVSTEISTANISQASLAPNQGPYSEAALRLDRLDVGAFHYRVMAIIGSGLLVESFENFSASSIVAALEKEGWTNVHVTSIFFGFTAAGLLIGGWLAGMIGDHLGRKKGFQLNLLLFGGAGFAAFFAPNMAVLIALRFLMGIGIGSEIVLGCSTLAEFLPPTKRGRLFSLLSFVTHGGGFFASVCGAFVIPSFGWRWMFMIAAIGATAVWFARRYMPESPRWLESKGRIEEARAVLDEIEASVYKIRSSSFQPFVADQICHTIAPKALASIWDLFSPRYIRSTIVGMLVMVTMQTCLYGVVMWMPTFFVAQGYPMDVALRWNAIITTGQPLCSIALIFLVDRIGRKALLVGSAILSIGLSLIYVLSNGHSIYLLLTSCFVFTVMAQILMTVGQGLYLSEIFPTQLRSRGIGVVSSTSRALLIVIQIGIPFIFATMKVAGIMIAADLMLLTFAIGLMILGHETSKRGLEDIVQ